MGLHTCCHVAMVILMAWPGTQGLTLSIYMPVRHMVLKIYVGFMFEMSKFTINLF